MLAHTLCAPCELTALCCSATMQKMVREALPPDIRVASDAFDLIIECCTGAPVAVAAWPDLALASDVEMALQCSCLG